ncbi:MAG: hypothetical protein LBH01_06610 [Verrucomicrobiales bacterium]|nr:hypothetical protein [Verrucomicrobiales bacterium]
MFSFFAKKKEEPQVAVAAGKTVNPALPVTGKAQAADVVPESFSKSTGFTGKKRVTQRLSVQAVRAFQNANNDLTGMPGETDNEAAEEPGRQVSIDLPSEVVLRVLPDEVLAAPREILIQQLLPGSKVSLPLASILPMLPSGRLEFAVQEVSPFLPGHFLQAPESLNGQTFVLPLFEVASRIPQDALRLRDDQRPIDSLALRMDDPFNPEQLRAAAEAAEAAAVQEEVLPPVVPPAPPEPAAPVISPAPFQVKAVEPEIKAAIPELPVRLPMPPPAPVAPAIPVFKEEVPLIEPELKKEELVADEFPVDEPQVFVPSASTEEELAAEPVVAPEIAPLAGETTEPDFSFAQTEQFRKFLEQLESEIATKNAAQSESAEPPLSPVPLEPLEIPAEEAPVIPAFSFPTAAKEDVPPIVPGSDILVEAKEEPAPLPPDVLTFKPLTPPPPAPAEFPAPAAIIPPLAPLPVEEPKVEPLPPAPAKLQAQPEPAPAAALPSPPIAHFGQPAHPVNLSPRVNDILGLPAEHDLTLKDVVAHVRRWPGVKGCAIVDKGGLPIAFDMNDSEFARTLSAFAPKILSRVHELFADIGLLGAPEIQVPSDEFSTYICRHGDVYFVLLHDDVNMPVWYSVIVKQILAELSFAPSEA